MFAWKQGSDGQWLAEAGGTAYEIRKHPTPLGGSYFSVTHWPNKLTPRAIGASSTLTGAQNIAEDHYRKRSL